MILRDTPAKVRAYVTDAEGEALPQKGAPGVTVAVTRDSDGEVVTTGAASFEDNGVVVSELPPQSSVDLLTFTWTIGTTTVVTTEEIVGARLCTLEAIAALIDSSVTPDTATLRAARDIAEQLLEAECGVAFRPRYAREVLDGSGQNKILLRHPKVSAIRSGSVDETALTVGDLKLYEVAGAVWSDERWVEGAQNVDIAYEHGFKVVPAQASRVCALLARHIATKRPSNMDDRATSYSTDEATYSLITPGVRGMATAIPEVNAFIEAWRFPTVV